MRSKTFFGKEWQVRSSFREKKFSQPFASVACVPIVTIRMYVVRFEFGRFFLSHSVSRKPGRITVATYSISCTIYRHNITNLIPISKNSVGLHLGLLLSLFCTDLPSRHSSTRFNEPIVTASHMQGRTYFFAQLRSYLSCDLNYRRRV